MDINLYECLEWISTHVWNALKQIGGAAIIIAIATFVSSIIMKRHEIRLESKYEHKIEKLKTDLDYMKHIQLSQFDNEYTIYQDLFAKFSALKDAVHWLFPMGLDRAPAYDKDGMRKIIDERYVMAQKKYNEATEYLGSKAPFMQEENYNEFVALLRLAAGQIHRYAFANPLLEKTSEVQKIEQKGFDVTKEIDDKWDCLVKKLRAHFASLKQEEKYHG